MSIPFMPLYVADYIGDTQHLSAEQHGCYLLLLMAMWRSGGHLPNDAAKLARIVRLSPARWGRIADDVMAFFVVDGDGITQKRLAAEIEKASKKSQVRSDAGRAGAEAKALKNNNAAKAKASRLLKHSPEPEPDREDTSSLRSAVVGGADEPEPPDATHALDAPPPEPNPPDDVAEAFAAYNAEAALAGWPAARRLDPRRRAALRQRLAECGGLPGWRGALARARASPHLTGSNDRGWTADLDFLLQAKSFTRLLEGAYDDRRPRRDDASRRAGHGDQPSRVGTLLAALAEQSALEPGGYVDGTADLSGARHDGGATIDGDAVGGGDRRGHETRYAAGDGPSRRQDLRGVPR